MLATLEQVVPVECHDNERVGNEPLADDLRQVADWYQSDFSFLCCIEAGFTYFFDVPSQKAMATVTLNSRVRVYCPEGDDVVGETSS